MAASLPEDAPLPPLEALSVVIDYGRAGRARDRQVEATKKSSAALSASTSSGGEAMGSVIEGRQNHSVAELEGLQLRYQPSWLLTMIGGGQAIESYCQVPGRHKP